MKNTLLRITVSVLLVTLLAGCAREEFMDLYGFTERFSYSDITPENFYIEKDDNGNDIYYTFFEKENPRVMLKLICSEENKIDEVRIYLPKYDENADKKTISTEDIKMFVQLVINTTEAFTGYNKTEAEKTAEQMLLYEKSSYEKEGELTKRKDNFFFLYHSAHLGSEFIIYNTFLKKVPETEKPESKPLYGDTTKIRTETVPTK